ncbi:MAG: (d)CMP kinase [Hyphomonadaceae bacterium]
MIIAIDGTTSSGKGTLAKRLAAHYGLPHLDTGLLYRAVAKSALNKGIDFKDERECALLAQHIDLAEFDERELRGAGVGAAASVVASLGAVRRALFDLQRNFAQQKGGAVLDGRDIGTVIAPDADVKLWVDASVEERARRRFLELSGMGEDVTEHGVLMQLKERDARDAERKDAPMKPADDAIWIDTTTINQDQTVAKAIDIVEAHRGKPKKAPAKKATAKKPKP